MLENGVPFEVPLLLGGVRASGTREGERVGQVGRVDVALHLAHLLRPVRAVQAEIEPATVGSAAQHPVALLGDILDAWNKGASGHDRRKTSRRARATIPVI